MTFTQHKSGWWLMQAEIKPPVLLGPAETGEGGQVWGISGQGLVPIPPREAAAALAELEDYTDTQRPPEDTAEVILDHMVKGVSRFRVSDQFGILGQPPKKSRVMSFLPVARAMRDMSKDPSTQVGAVALDSDFNVLAAAYNGFPRGVQDSPELLADRAQKYPRIVHAEANLVAQAARTGAALLGSTVILTSLHPCSQCAGLLAQAGVRFLVAPMTPDNQRWDDSSATAMDILAQAGVHVLFYEDHY